MISKKMKKETKKEEAKKFKIGIVDDHVQTAISISQMLEYNRFETFQIYNSKDVVKTCLEENPDLILMDIRMDGADGYELAKQLSDYKIMIMSGYEMDGEKISKLKNVVDRIQKPIDINVLLTKIRMVLKNS